MKYRVRVSRAYWHYGYVEVEAPDEAQARELAVDQIDNIDMKIGDILPGDHAHKVEQIGGLQLCT